MSNDIRTPQDQLSACKEQVAQLQQVAKELGEATTTVSTLVKDIDAKKQLFVKYFEDVQKSLAAIASAAGPPTTNAASSKPSETFKIVITSLLTLVAGFFLAWFTLWINMQSAKDVEFAKALATQAFPDAQKVKAKMNLTFTALNNYLANLGDPSEAEKRKAYVDAEDALSKTLSAATVTESIKNLVQQTIAHFQDAKVKMEGMNAGPDRDMILKTTLDSLSEETKRTYKKIDDWLFPPTFRG